MKCFIVCYEADLCQNGNFEKVITDVYAGEPDEEKMKKIAIAMYNEFNDDNELTDDELIDEGVIDVFDNSFIFDVDHESREFFTEVFELQEI